MLAGVGIAIPACMLLGALLERVAYRPLRDAPRLTALITAIGMSIVLQNLAMIVWGRQYISFPPLLPNEPRARRRPGAALASRCPRSAAAAS